MTAIFKAEDLSFRLTGTKVLNLNIEISKGESLVISAEDREGLKDLVNVIENPVLRSGGEIYSSVNYSIIKESDRTDKSLKGRDEFELAAILSGSDKKRAFELAEQYELSHLLPLRIHRFTEYESYMLKFICSLLNEPKLLILEDPLLRLGATERTSLLNNLILFVKDGGSLLILTTRPGEFTNLNPKFLDLRGAGLQKFESSPNRNLNDKRVSLTAPAEEEDFKVRDDRDYVNKSRKISFPDETEFHEVKEKIRDIMPELDHVAVKLPVSKETEFVLRRISIVRFFEASSDSYILEVKKEDVRDLIKVLKSRGLSPGGYEILQK